MHIKDVINVAIDILELKDVDYLSDDEDVRRLYSSANYVYSELTVNYIDLRKIEEHVVKNSVLQYNQFEEPVREILAVKVGDKNLKFKMYDDYLAVDGYEGNVIVDYVYKGGHINQNSVLSVPPFFSEYMLATGIASEFCFRKGLLDEASYYKSKYEDWLKNFERKVRHFCLPRRRLVC